MRGYAFTAVVPESASLERRALLRSYGAELVLSPAAEHAGGALARAKALAARTGAVFLDQFGGIEEGTLGAELVAQARAVGGLEAFVAGAGTGSSFNAVARRIRAALDREASRRWRGNPTSSIGRGRSRGADGQSALGFDGPGLSLYLGPRRGMSPCENGWLSPSTATKTHQATQHTVALARLS